MADSINHREHLSGWNSLVSASRSGRSAGVRRELAHEPEMKGKLIVVILPDSGERYLSSALTDGLD